MGWCAIRDRLVPCNDLFADPLHFFSGAGCLGAHSLWNGTAQEPGLGYGNGSNCEPDFEHLLGAPFRDRWGCAGNGDSVVLHCAFFCTSSSVPRSEHSLAGLSARGLHLPTRSGRPYSRNVAVDASLVLRPQLSATRNANFYQLDPLWARTGLGFLDEKNLECATTHNR